MTAAEYIRALPILPWSEAPKIYGRRFFAMRGVDTLAILYECREAIIPYAEGKVNLATARLNFKQAILDQLGKAPDFERATSDECFNSAARTYSGLYAGARNYYGWRS